MRNSNPSTSRARRSRLANASLARRGKNQPRNDQTFHYLEFLAREIAGASLANRSLGPFVAPQNAGRILAAFPFIFRGVRNNKGKRPHMKVVNRNAAALIGLVLAAFALAAPAEARSGHAGFHARGHHIHAARHAHIRHARASHRIHAAHSQRYAFRFANRVRHVRHASGGNASWYGPGFNGHRTASGERFNAGGLTAAHRSLPFGTRVRVTNNATGRSVVVRINDRGPFVGGRQIDLAAGAARAIGMSGTSYVSMAVVR